MILELQTKRFSNSDLLLPSLYKQIFVSIETKKDYERKRDPYSNIQCNKTFGAIRFKTQINHFLSLGLRLLHDHVLEMTKELCYIQTKHYINTNVFAASPSKKNIFTVLAKENIDFNAFSSAVIQQFRGTSMTTMQFVPEENLGEEKLIL